MCREWNSIVDSRRTRLFFGECGILGDNDDSGDDGRNDRNSCNNRMVYFVIVITLFDLIE